MPSKTSLFGNRIRSGSVPITALGGGVVSSSNQVDYNSIQNKLSGVISSSTQFNALSGTSASFATTASFALTSAGGGGGGGGVFVTASDPTLTVNPTTTGSLWLNSSSGQLFVNSDRTTNANEWLNLSTGSNIAIGNAFYSFVTASTLRAVSGAATPLLVQLKDRFNKFLNINTEQTIVITGSDGTYTSTIYSASGIFTSSVIGPNKTTGSFTVSGSINGTLLTPITLAIVEPQTLHGLGNSSMALPTASGYISQQSSTLTGTGGPQILSSTVTWDSASTNGLNTLASTVDGKLYAWGYSGNLFGTGSFNTAGGRTTPTLVGTGSLTSSVWVQHSVGYQHAAAIRNDGTLWTWGTSISGALGLGPTILSASVPTRVGTDSNWVAVSCGNNCTFALKSDTTLWAVGLNTNGQLGVGNTETRFLFGQVIGENFSPRIFAAADRTSYVIKNNGTMFAAGWRGFIGSNWLGLSLVPDGTGAATPGGSNYPLNATSFSQESLGLTNWITVIPSRGGGMNVAYGLQNGYDSSNYYLASYGVAGTNFYGWGAYKQNGLHSRGHPTNYNNGPNPSSAIPVLEPYITTSGNIYLLNQAIYEIDSTGSLNVWGNYTGSIYLHTNYGITLPTASTIAGLLITPQNNQLSTSSGQQMYNNAIWGNDSTKVFGAKNRVGSTVNFKTFAKGTVYVNNNQSNLIVLRGKISGSNFPSASGAPTSLTFTVYTGSSPSVALPQYAYIQFTNTLDDAEIQVSSSYPNATGSSFVTYIGPSSSRAYISPPSYSINIKHDLRYFKNGIGSPTTASITANYCPGNGYVLSGSCNNGQFSSITANGACGVTVGAASCNYSQCSFQYSYYATNTGPCTDLGYNYGTYYQYCYQAGGYTCTHCNLETFECYY